MNINKETTLESLIENLDERGLLVLQVLIGQQSMKVLSNTAKLTQSYTNTDTNTKPKAKSKSNIIIPN